MPTLPFAVIPTPLGTIATGNERAEKPASHLGEFKAPGMTWKSNGNSNLWIRGDFGTAKPIDFVSMLAANALPGTTFRINLASTQTDVDGPGFRAISDNGNTTTVNLSGPYSVEKTSGADGAYNASAVSLASISGDFVLRIKPVTTNKDMFFGVNTDPLTDNTNSSIDRAIYFPGNPALGARVWENGVQLFTGPAYSTSQYWFIRRIGSTITYLVGTSTDVDEATLVYTGASSSAAMHFDSAISGLNGKAEVYFTHGGYDSGEVPFINPSITREDGLYHSHIELPKKVSQRWWRIDISGHTGDFEAAMLVMGEKLTPANWYSPGWQRGVEDLGDISINRYGIADEQAGQIWRTLMMRFGWMSEADYETKFGPLVERLGKRGVALWCFDPTSSIYRQRKTYYGYLRNSPIATHSRDTPAGIRYDKEFQILSMF